MQNSCSLNKEHLKSLAKDKNNTVLVEEHEIIFEPWPAKRVRKCTEMLVEIVKASNGEKEDIRKEALKKIELVKFSNYHHTFFERFTDPEYVNNPKFLTGIEMMLKVKEKTETGEVEEGEEADKKIASSLMKNFHAPQ